MVLCGQRPQLVGKIRLRQVGTSSFENSANLSLGNRLVGVDVLTRSDMSNAQILNSRMKFGGVVRVEYSNSIFGT